MRAKAGLRILLRGKASRGNKEVFWNSVQVIMHTIYM